MSDIFTKKKRSEIMSRIKNKNSGIEKQFADILRKFSIKYRTHPLKLFGKPDFILIEQKIPIFIDSCFWHGCGYHCKLPESNKNFWREKIRNNRIRDKKIRQEYGNNDKKIIRVWEHELKNNNKISKIIDKIKDMIKK